mgnify:CR=1 FL=1
MNYSDNIYSDIASNLSQVQERISEACARARRNPNEVTLIAVSKTKPYEAIEVAWAAGVRDFGENYVQELTQKIQRWNSQESDRPIRWHMIGHLQKNKVKYLIGNVALIHSVDSLSLAEQIEKESAKKATKTNILLEVNVAGEKSKWGFNPTEVPDAAYAIAQLPHIRLLGLMTSAPYTLQPESNRLWFRLLFDLGQQLKAEDLLSQDKGLPKLPILSMGMSGDFEVAVEEGATMVRVGTSIFGERDYGINTTP